MTHAIARLKRRRTRRVLAVTGMGVAVLAVNIGPATSAVNSLNNYRLVNSRSYQDTHGSWSSQLVPERYRLNAVHAALLHTGKVLMVAGSGNDRNSFAAGTFKTSLWDPATDTYKEIPTPDDFFCAGHAFLPDGRLVIAGGTQRYELLAGEVTKAAGAMTVRNEDPDSAPVTLKKGTRFTGPNGKVYQSTNDVTLAPATKMVDPGGTMVHPSSEVVWVEALDKGPDSVITGPGQYAIQGLSGDQAHNIYGQAQKVTLDKQDFQGTQTTYVFDPITEKYDRVEDMKYKRWYATLVGLGNGDLLASSGLDGTGQVLQGQTEVLNHQTLKWTEMTNLTQYFPTYPSLFLTASGKLFYSGSNSGYGPADRGRQPGLWNLSSNTLQLVPGLKDADQLETSGSVMLPPVQDQKVMVMGGGGVGESHQSTARTAVVDLKPANPAFVPGPDLAVPTRYPNIVLLPDDTVLVTGGSQDYRGRNASDNLISRIYDPASGAFHDAASPSIGRDYHSEAILLPDGRVVTLGSNPLFSDKENTQSASFEQRVEIYSPPYLFRGSRPVITDGPVNVDRGQSYAFAATGAAGVTTARLMRPSAATHVTDVEQRDIALGVTQAGGGVRLSIPSEATIAPAGWYMLTVSGSDRVPSIARWVHVS